MSSAPLPPPGWYDDPDAPSGSRYWNGSAWTEDRRATMPPPGVAPRTRDNTNAITALVLSLLGIVACGVLSPVGMVMGRNEVERIDSGAGDPGARGMAHAAYIVGIIGTALLVLAVVAIIVFAIIVIAAAPS